MLEIHTKFKELSLRERVQRVMAILLSVNPMGTELLRPRSQQVSLAVPSRRQTTAIVQCGPPVFVVNECSDIPFRLYAICLLYLITQRTHEKP